MSLFNSSRFRIVIVFSTLIVLPLCFALTRQIASVRAAKRAFVAEGPRVGDLPGEPTPRPEGTPVLVELFTSEGCSSCPPADALLARLDRTQPVAHTRVIALEEHVDYWDSLGWKDRFSSHQLTERQSAYAQRLHLDDVYTPQMVVDGTDQFVGNDSSHALRAISQAAQAPKLMVSISQPAINQTHVVTTVKLAKFPGSLPGADVFAAVVEPMASTRVLKGENGGRVLQHVSVVRTLQPVGSLADLTASPLKVSLDVPKNAAGFRVVVFIQRAGPGKILGVAVSAPTSTASTSFASTQ